MSLYLLCGATPIGNPAPAKNKQQSQAQRAIFMASKMWAVGSTIKIYIFDFSNIRIISNDEYQNMKNNDASKAELSKYIFWYDFSWVPASEKEKYFDPLYNQIQGKVTPGELVRRVVLDSLAPLVNLKLEFTTNINESHIRVKFDSTRGCNSLIGTDNLLSAQGLVSNVGPTDPTMYLAWLDVATTLHEFCHVLGMNHEHQNPNENPIQWDISGVDCYFKDTNGWTSDQVYINIIKRYNTSEINGSNFDPASIMLYSFPATASCCIKAATTKPDGSVVDVCTNRYVPVNITSNGKSTSSTYKLSNSDKQWLQYVYPANGIRDPEVIKNLPRTVLQTDVFDPKNVSNMVDQTLEYLKDNWRLAVYVVGGIVGIYCVYKILSKSKQTEYEYYVYQ